VSEINLIFINAAVLISESGISAVDKRFIVSVRCSIRLEVPLWDPDAARLASSNVLPSSSHVNASASDQTASSMASASSLDSTLPALSSSSSSPSCSSAPAPPPSAKLLVDETYLRFLLDSANRKYATNEARIRVFHRMYRAAFTDAALLRSLPPIPGSADMFGTDVSETREGDAFADDASLASATQQLQQAQQQSLVTTAAAASAMSTLLGLSPSSLSSVTSPSSSPSSTQSSVVWALAAPLRCSRLVQDAVRARDFRRLELKLVTLPAAAPTHIGMLQVSYQTSREWGWGNVN
jgi:hypothetical protein